MPRKAARKVVKTNANGHARKNGGGSHGRWGPRAKGLIWTGHISFGLVNIPVELHSGEVRSDLSFKLLDRRDMAPIGYRKINKNTEEDVPNSDIVKGYPIDGKFVLMSDADFKKASPERTQRMEIDAFVDAHSIEPPYFERPYFLKPAAKSEKAYGLLREALRRSGKAGIGEVVIKAKQYLAAILPYGSALMLELLRFSHELKDPKELHLPSDDLKKLRVSEAELKMAERLIADLEGPWKPERYKDVYHDELLAFIGKKAKAGKLEASPETEAEPSKKLAPPPPDIMALLKASVARAETSRGGHPRSKYMH